MESEKLDVFQVGPCENGYQMGFLIGKRFGNLIRSRLQRDLILQAQLLPFAKTAESQPLIQALINNNQTKFPTFWDELTGIADGTGVPFLDVNHLHSTSMDIMLINLRKEIIPFLPKKTVEHSNGDNPDDCSDVLVVSDSMAVAAHNEDANVALVGHMYLIKGILSSGVSFIAYTYAGELPSCAFGFNNHGVAFTLNSVPPTKDEVAAGGIGRNFISRDLLESTSLEDALTRICSAEVSIGHSYNLIDVQKRRILNVETASKKRVSVHEIGATPFFHANMYLHLQVNQVQDESSMRRQTRAAMLPKRSKEDFLSILGDKDDTSNPIYMTGPSLYTLATALIDMDDKTLSIIEGNPKERRVCHMFCISSVESIKASKEDLAAPNLEDLLPCSYTGS